MRRRTLDEVDAVIVLCIVSFLSMLILRLTGLVVMAWWVVCSPLLVLALWVVVAAIWIGVIFTRRH